MSILLLEFILHLITASLPDFDMEDYERNMVRFKALYKKKSDWIERVKGIKFSLDSLQCIENCYFYDKSYNKCDFCKSRSKISWILKTCLHQMIHGTGNYFHAFVEMVPRPSFCNLIQNFDDVVYMMELIEFDIGQDAESHNDGQFSWLHNVIQITIHQLRNYHTTAADQIETLSL